MLAAAANLGMCGEMGVPALADAGRVYAAGKSFSRWHTAYGGGLWLGFLGRTRIVGALYARG